MIMPNFLIIGAAKSGTTSLSKYINQHPEVYMGLVKETNFFALKGKEFPYRMSTITPGYFEKEIITDIAAYEALFKGLTNETAIGEASPIYLYSKDACESIHSHIPNAKLIVILRNPVDRAYSNFLHHLREGLETTDSFDEALAQEEERIHDYWWWGFHYTKAGFYYEQLKRYFDRFDSKNIKVFLYEDLISDSERLLQDIFEFLSLDINFIPSRLVRQNVSGIPKNKFWHEFLSKPSLVKEPLKLLIPAHVRQQLAEGLRNKNLAKPSMAPETRDKLKALFRDDILQLQDLIQRDLSSWL